MANAPTTSADTESELFGSDLLFNDDLQLTASSDYALVTGQAALRQAIKLRLITSPGEYAVRPEFGCGVQKWVKKRASRSDRDALRQVIIDQLSKETRIQKVIDVTVDLIAGLSPGLTIGVRVQAIGREQSFSFTTFSE